MDKNTRSGLFGGQIILERKHTLHLNFVCSLVVPSIYIYYLDDSTRKRKMGLGDLWPPHSREDSKAGLCHFFYFAVTSAARVRRPPRLFSWITAICAAVVQLQECGHPLLRLSLLLMFCTLCSSVTYYTIILYLVQEKSLFEAAAVVVEAVGGRVVDGVILGTAGSSSGGGGGLCWKC